MFTPHPSNLQLTGWKASTEKALQALERLRDDVKGLSGEVEEVKGSLETAGDSIRNEQKETTKVVEKRVAAVKVRRVTCAQKFDSKSGKGFQNLSYKTGMLSNMYSLQAEISDLLSSNRRDMLEAVGRMERRTDEESRRLRALEENVLDIEGDVEVNLNTTAYLENKMLVMERDGERDQFERQVSSVSSM